MQLGVSLFAVAVTLERREGFRSLIARVRELLSQNVAAAMYSAAIQGKVGAQTYYLKHCPPPDWPAASAAAAEGSPDELTDDELIARFRAEAPALLDLLSREDAPPGGAAQP
jgi:hypothetical protein